MIIVVTNTSGSMRQTKRRLVDGMPENENERKYHFEKAVEIKMGKANEFHALQKKIIQNRKQNGSANDWYINLCVAST